MPRISTDAEITAIRMKERASAPDTPASGYGQLYLKDDGKFYFKNDAGTEACLSDVIDKMTNPMTTAGDIIYGGASGAPTRLAAGTEDYVLTMGASAPEWAAAGGSGGGLYSAYICIQDQKTQNTAGGTFTAGAWRTRDLNTEVADTGNHASITSNQITLAAGTYQCRIKCPAFAVNNHQAKLYNIDDSADVVIGSTEYSRVATGYGHTSSMIIGRFTLAATKVLEVQHYCNTTFATEGFGTQANFTTEVYTIAEFWKES